MVHMTRHGRGSWFPRSYVVLGCELLNEFRKNGSSDRMQQMLTNDSDGFVWLSVEDYRGLIRADGVYYVEFGECDEGGYQTPTFVLHKPRKIVNRWIHEDRFPNAVPEIRYAHKVDKVVRDWEYDSMNAEDNESMYDGCDRSSYP